jgi:hypothetical protein
MAYVVPEDRKYQRILLSDASINKLDSLGYEWVYSSNVSAATTRGNDLIIRFHNSSVYSYKGKANLYERLMGAASKGKWVWRFLRRPGVPYEKIGSLPLPEDINVSDEEIIRPIKEPKYIVESIVPSDYMTTGNLPSILITPISQAQAMMSSGSGGMSALASMTMMAGLDNGIISAVTALNIIKGT